MQHIGQRLAAVAALLSLVLPAPRGSAAAEEVRVALDAQKAVAVTIYNENLALVRDRRRVTLQRGENRIAFIDVSGVIVGLDDMQPRTTDIHRPNRPYRYALEVNQGWFARHGVVRGQKVRFVKTVDDSGPSR